MTEAELLELMVMTLDSLGSHAMNYFTLLFGYLLCAYFVGHRLSQFQLASLTAFYTILAPFPCIASYEMAKEYSRLTADYYIQYRGDEVIPTFAESGILLLPYVLGGTWLLSVIFMFQGRRAKMSEHAAPNKAIEADA